MIENKNYIFNFEKALDEIEKITDGYFCYHREICLYRKLLNNIRVKSYINSNEPGKEAQFFEAEFGEISETSGVFYIMVWNVQSAQTIIKMRKLIPVEYNVAKYESSFQQACIDNNKAFMAQYNKEPVIFVKGPHNEDVLIDGNHRFFNALANKKRSITAYMLSMEDSIKCIHTEELRTIFKIHKNIIEIGNHIAGLNSKKLYFCNNFKKGALFPLYSNVILQACTSFLFLLDL